MIFRVVRRAVSEIIIKCTFSRFSSFVPCSSIFQFPSQFLCVYTAPTIVYVLLMFYASESLVPSILYMQIGDILYCFQFATSPTIVVVVFCCFFCFFFTVHSDSLILSPFLRIYSRFLFYILHPR